MSQKFAGLKKSQTVSEEARTAMYTAKIDLVRKYPWMGMLIMGSEYMFSDDLPTAAATTVPTPLIIFNPKFLTDELKDRGERAFVLAHEALHIFLMHIGRQAENGYHHGLWNVATDFMINSFLKELGCSLLNMPDMCLYDAKFKSKGADEIYHILLEEANQDPEQAAANYGGGGASGGKNGKSGGKGKYGKDYQRPIDEVDSTRMSDSTKNDIKQRIAGATANAGGSDSMSTSGVGDLLRELEALVESVVPWQQLLQEFVKSTTSDRYTYNRISRRSGRVLFPTRDGEAIDIVIGVDTSGSMSQSDIDDAMSEIKGILSTYDNWTMTLLSCDTGVTHMGDFNSEDGDDFSVVASAGLNGGGGTDMDVMVDYVMNGDIDRDELPSVMVVITDGYIPDIPSADEDEMPVLVVVTRQGNQQLELDNCQVIQMSHEA